jgi:trehalose 6-phosphate phosphatase
MQNLQAPQSGELPGITEQTALFLDFDGTLVELAPTPGQVHLAAGTIDTLKALERKLGGALALVSGRSLADLDSFLKPLALASAAEHGAMRRSAVGLLSGAEPLDLQHAVNAAQTLAQKHPALLVERKTRSISLHYRQAPELEAECVAAMQAAMQRSTGLELIMGKFVVELKPHAVSKGTAIDAFMQETPFKGRHSIFVGDDVTDESGFVAVQAMGGQAIKMGEGETAARYRCANVAQLMAWLQAAAVQGEGEGDTETASHSNGTAAHQADA